MKKIFIFILCFLVVFSLIPSTLTESSAASPTSSQAEKIAKPTSSSVLIDGTKVDFTAYNIDGNNYFKLRDLAAALRNSPKKFSVAWDGEKSEIALKTGKAYELIGGELTISGDKANQKAKPTKSSLYYDDLYAEFQAYLIQGNNYFKLRDIGRIINFGVDWDAKENSIFIDTSDIYKNDTSSFANYPKPFEKGYFTGLNNPVLMGESMGVTFSADKEVTFMTPYDANIDRAILVENKGKQSVIVDFSFFSKPLGLENDDMMPHPQPFFIILDPGERNVIRVVFQYAPTEMKSEDASLTCDLRLETLDRSKIEKLSFDLKNKVIIKDINHPQAGNSKIFGRITDKATGKALANQSIELTDGNFKFHTSTNAKGDYEVSVFAYKNARGFYNEYSLTVNSPSQEKRVVAPKPGASLKLDIAVAKKAPGLKYSVDTIIDTGVQSYPFDGTDDGSVLAAAPFHTGLPDAEREKYAYLHVFDYKGNLFFKKHIVDETPALDLSKDGSLIATTIKDHVSTEFNKVIVYDKKGQVHYKTDFIRDLSPLGDVYSQVWEVQISDNNKYLSYGDTSGMVWLVDMEKDKILWSDFTGTGQVRKIAFDRMDTVLYVSSGDGFLRCYTIDGDILWKTYVDAWVTSMEIGKNYLVTMNKASPCNIHVIDKYTGETLVSIPVTSGGSQVALSPDESLIWYGNTVSSGKSSLSNNVYDIHGNMKYSFTGMPGRQAVFSADSNILVFNSNRKLVVANREGQILWQEDIAPKGAGVSAGNLLWMSPDGKYIVVDINMNPNNTYMGQLHFLSRK